MKKPSYSAMTTEGLEAMLDSLIHHAKKSNKKTGAWDDNGTTRVKKVIIKTVFSERKRLDDFFKRIAKLTSNHQCIGDKAVVYPRDLGAALSEVDPEWWLK
jgi:hypothetical protein